MAAHRTLFDRLPRRRLERELVALYGIAFLMQLAVGIMPPVLPALRESLGVSVAEVSVVVSAFALTRLALDLPLGSILDRAPVRTMLLGGSAITGFGALVGWQAEALPLIIVARGLMGVGSTVCVLTTYLALSRAASPHNRGRLFGFYLAAGVAGASLSPFLSGALASLFDWRAAFALSVVATTLAASAILLTKWPSPVAYYRVDRPEKHECEMQGWHLALGMKPGSMMPILAANLAVLVLHFFSAGFSETVVPLIGATRLGLGTAALGTIIGLATLVYFATSVPVGELADRFGRAFVLAPGLLVIGAGVFAVNYVENAPTYVSAILVMALGRSCSSIPLAIMVDHAQSRYWGRALAVNRFMADLGMAGGPLALAWIVDRSGYDTAAAVTAALLWVTALVVFAGVRRVKV